MSKFTPGPWEVAYLDENEQAVVKAKHIEIATCWHHCVQSIEQEMHANARLIAAAPEMYEVLRRIREGCAFPEDDVQRAIRDVCRDILAKIDGDSND